MPRAFKVNFDVTTWGYIDSTSSARNISRSQRIRELVRRGAEAEQLDASA
jgi:hypothetical protein